MKAKLESINEEYLTINGETYIYRLMKYENFKKLEIGDVFEIIGEGPNHLPIIRRIKDKDNEKIK